MQDYPNNQTNINIESTIIVIIRHFFLKNAKLS